MFASFINYLDGAYLSAQDIGISLNDIRIVSQLSKHVLDNVDPGPYTAKGIYYALDRLKIIALMEITKIFLYKDLAVLVQISHLIS